MIVRKLAHPFARQATRKPARKTGRKPVRKPFGPLRGLILAVTVASAGLATSAIAAPSVLADTRLPAHGNVAASAPVPLPC